MIRTLKIRTLKEPKTVKAEILKDIKRDYKIDCFIYKGTKLERVKHRPKEIKWWYICDYQTGLAITGGKTKETALESFLSWLKVEGNINTLIAFIARETKDKGILNTLPEDD